MKNTLNYTRNTLNYIKSTLKWIKYIHILVQNTHKCKYVLTNYV